MIAELTHEQAADEIEAVALGIATDEVTQAVTAHAARCPECAAELRSFYHVVTALSALIPAKQLNRGHSAGIKSRLVAKTAAGQEGGLARLRARPEPARAPEVRAPVPRAPRSEPEVVRETAAGREIPGWVLVLAGIASTALAAAITFFLFGKGDGAAPAQESGEVVTSDSRVAELEQSVAQRDSILSSVTGPGVRIISLYNREAREPLARMFWDRRSDRWTLFVYSLRQPRQGKAFQVWLGTDEGRVSLGTFQPAADGTATFTTEHALPIASLSTVSISEENAGGSSAPTGVVVLAGSLR